MPIRSIDKIKIGNYADGQFAGGYIYSAQITQGYAENANKLTIDLVYSNNSTINLPEKNLVNSYRVQFGDIVFPQMYFYAHSKSVGVNEQIITCSFVDGSFLLDKYFVGLTNRHYKVSESSQRNVVSVYCANCDNTLGIKTGTVTRNLADSPNLLVNNLLVVGDEEFVDQTCDVPDVKYNFTSLLATMAKIPNFNFKNFIDINNYYKTSYTGTLREVLSNWCSDFGFSFYWDFITNSLICIDLRNPVDLTSVSNFINSNFNQNSSNLPISSFSEDESLEGTYQQDNVDYVLKPSQSKDREIKDFFPITYSPVNISTSYPDDLRALAKFNKQARTLYHLQNGQYSSIGLNASYLGIESYVLQTALQNIYEFIYNSAGAGRIVIGKYNQDVDDLIASNTASSAEDIGKYYTNLSYVKWNSLICNQNAKSNLSISYEPQPIFGSRPWTAYGATATLPAGNVWIIERSSNYQSYNTSSFNLDGCGPIFMDIQGEVADQVQAALKKIGVLNSDKYRGLTIVAYKPYLRVTTQNNVWNSSEEDFTAAEYQTNEIAGCQIACEKDTTSEICRQSCTTLVAPGHGLTSKFSTAYTYTNLLNGTSMTIVLPSTQPYLGYIKADGTFTYTQPGIKSMTTPDSNFKANTNVMAYSINLNDITTNEPSVGTIDFKRIDQNSHELDIIQTNSKKSISLKIIGMNYGLLNDYLNPKSGLTSFNVYINDNGVFTDLSFENRPAQKPKPEAIIQKIGPQKIRLNK
jgi:hypothetical protein